MQTISNDQIINLFFMMDEFCAQFHQVVKSHSISDRGRHRNKPNRMSDAEVMLILIIFHFGEFNELFINDIQLVTKFKNNMKNALMSWEDKILLRKRSVIESVNDELKVGSKNSQYYLLPTINHYLFEYGNY